MATRAAAGAQAGRTGGAASICSSAGGGRGAGLRRPAQARDVGALAAALAGRPGRGFRLAGNCQVLIWGVG